MLNSPSVSPNHEAHALSLRQCLNKPVSAHALCRVRHSRQSLAYITITPILRVPYSYHDSITFHSYRASQSHSNITFLQFHKPCPFSLNL